MNDTPDTVQSQLEERRRRVGLVAGGCLLVALGMLLFNDIQNAVASSLLRIGLVFGALWLALPTKSRPAAWAQLSRWKMAGLVAFAILLPRLKFFLPILLIGVAVGWMLRPKKKRSGRR